MSFFNNLKKILFEEDVDMPPSYDKQDEEVVVERQEEEKKEPEVKVVTESRVKIKRDLEIDDSDILADIPVQKVNPVRTDTVKEEVKVRQVIPEELPKKDDSIFPGFDEAEFNKLNSRIERNEVKNREMPKRENNDIARRANNNFSATSSTKIEKQHVEGPKKFTPSPVLSPVFGVLNVNYTKEDIVDKKDGIKREKLKPIKKVEEKKVPEEIKEDLPIEVDIDSVRKKAYGELEDLEKTLLEKEVEINDVPEVVEETIMDEPLLDEPIIEDVKEEIVPEEEIISEEIIEDKPIIDLDEEEEEIKPRLLDDLEKTSTLQILDDIEKELNAIKPINKEEVEEVNEDYNEPSIEKSDTLENDLFNLIDSMYTDKEDDK